MPIMQHRHNLKHHGSFITLLIRKKLSDSCVGKSFTCDKRNTATIVNHIGDHFLNELKEQMTIYLFSIMLSGSNDTGLQKILNVDSYIRC